MFASLCRIQRFILFCFKYGEHNLSLNECGISLEGAFKEVECLDVVVEVPLDVGCIAEDNGSFGGRADEWCNILAADGSLCHAAGFIVEGNGRIESACMLWIELQCAFYPVDGGIGVIGHDPADAGGFKAEGSREGNILCEPEFALNQSNGLFPAVHFEDEPSHGGKYPGLIWLQLCCHAEVAKNSFVGTVVALIGIGSVQKHDGRPFWRIFVESFRFPSINSSRFVVILRTFKKNRIEFEGGG